MPFSTLIVDIRYGIAVTTIKRAGVTRPNPVGRR